MMRTDVVAAGAAVVVVLGIVAMPSNTTAPPPSPRQGISVVRVPSVATAQPVADTTPATTAEPADADPAPHWEGEDQPGIWATPATFSETD